jgi:predicted esterase
MRQSLWVAVVLWAGLVLPAAHRVRAGEEAAEKEAKPKLEFATGKLVRKVVTKHDPDQSYALYLPKSYDPAKRWPILYGFSPGARGVNPVYLFQPAAEKYGWIVVGSNNSRNGPWAPISAAIKAILKDTAVRLSIDRRRRYATGFSGGGRVGFYVAMQHKFAGVIPVGAGMSRNQKFPAKGQLVVFSMCGVRCFNHAELLRLEQRLRGAGVRNRMGTFDGGHTWASREMCGAALRYMELLWQLDQEKRDDGLIKEMLKAEKADAEKLLETKGQYMRGHGRFKELAELDANGGFVERLAKIEETEKYKKEKALADELEKMRADLAKITDANERFNKSVARYAKFAADNKGTEAAERLTILLRATAQQMQMGASILMRRKDYRRAEVYLKRARIFAPDSNNLAYNLACALARNGKKKEALAALAEAVKLGFNKLEHMRKDPDLESLRDEEQFMKLAKVEGGEKPPAKEDPAAKEEAVPLL